MVAGAADNGIIDHVTFTLDRVPPPPPPLQVGVKIAPQANMFVRSGAARLTVTITCSRESWISITGDLSQSIGSRTIGGPIGGWVYCTDTISTPLMVSPMSGRFLPLRATAAVSISAYDPLLGELVSASDNHVLQLRPAAR